MVQLCWACKRLVTGLSPQASREWSSLGVEGQWQVAGLGAGGEHFLWWGGGWGVHGTWGAIWVFYNFVEAVQSPGARCKCKRLRAGAGSSCKEPQRDHSRP